MDRPMTRVLAVLELLQARGRMTGAELAERLEVDQRTVRRYLQVLQDLGIPVEGERGRAGGYRLRPGYKLPPLMLNDEEALAVMLGLQAAKRVGLVATPGAIEGALSKIGRVMPVELRRRLSAVQDALVTDLPPRGGYTPNSGVIVTLSEGVQQRRRVWISYADAQGQQTEREFDPYGLAFVSGRWYTAGLCHLRNDLRVFRLDRIVRIEPRAATFTPPSDLDPLAFVQASLATAPGAWTVEALLRTTYDEARRRVSPTVALLEETPEGVLLRAQTEDLEWMARRLVDLGMAFEVREPEELREELRRLAKRIAAAAGRRPAPSLL